MLARKVHNLGDFGFGDLIREHAAFPDTMVMYMQHDTRGFLPVLLEETLHDVDDELHGRVVVVQQQHAIEIGPLRYRFRPGDNNRAGVATVVVMIGAR